MKRIPGVVACGGIVIGPAYWYEQPVFKIEQYTPENIEMELARYRKAVKKVEADLNSLSENFEEGAAIFEIQIEFLSDPSFGELIGERIESEGYNAEYTVSLVSDELASEFEEIQDEYFAQRALDVKDLSNRLIKILLGINSKPFEDMKIPSIIFANDLTPSDTAYLDRDLVLGICTETGSSTSHTAIISRSMGIPSLVGLKKVEVDTGTKVIVDALEGVLILSPPEDLVDEYGILEENYNRKKEIVMARAKEPVITQDGESVDVFVNVGSLSDARLGRDFGAEGIGLLRTEFLFLDRKVLPDEDEQYKWYRDIASVYPESEVIIRTMDIGGDKEIPSFNLPKEQNPFLGQRAIRLALAEPELLLMPQLKAILRAGADYNVKILLPMIARTSEVKQIKAALEEAEKILEREGKKYSRVETGIMIELPSAALMADQFATMVDFFSIGTNDLTQYTLAVDRTNEVIADIADYFDPSVIRLISNVITKAHEHGKPVGMCGSMAGDPLATALLLGMGLDEFSMAAGMIPGIKDRLRRYNRKELGELVDSCLNAPDAETVRNYCKPFLLAE